MLLRLVLNIVFVIVLGKARDFLGVISEANKRLQNDAKASILKSVPMFSIDNAKEYDIEALTGHESEYIEMDLMLGVADLYTPEVVAVAESAIAGRQPVISLADSSSGTGSEDSSDDSGDDSSDSVSDSDEDGDHLTCPPPELKNDLSLWMMILRRNYPGKASQKSDQKDC
ncbi:hypothetical protein Acr_08g0013100 [Actinidia rufa]|uniref:Uncharacterized protein n=1 Tax=Actinidia rufa TaxID=165716 RepID=A0A7J0F2J9_9ERIC|nr:hypothetical protein Acr_08g0013100 [Actinidia rufa]